MTSSYLENYSTYDMKYYLYVEHVNKFLQEHKID